MDTMMRLGMSGWLFREGNPSLNADLFEPGDFQSVVAFKPEDHATRVSPSPATSAVLEAPRSNGSSRYGPI